MRGMLKVTPYVFDNGKKKYARATARSIVNECMNERMTAYHDNVKCGVSRHGVSDLRRRNRGL